MPIYEYECPKCDCHFELKKSFSDNGKTEPCPKCQGKARRVICPTAIVFKGSGFYVTDSRGHNSASDEGKPKDDNGKKPESKLPDTKK